MRFEPVGPWAVTVAAAMLVTPAALATIAAFLIPQAVLAIFGGVALILIAAVGGVIWAAATFFTRMPQ